MLSSRAVGVFVAIALLASSRASRAEPRGDPSVSFPLLVPHEKHYLRAVLEVGGVLVVGFVDYLLNTTDRGGTMRPDEARWRLRYDWPVLRDKLVGTGLNLDGNALATNYVSHPFAGTLYYTAARSNHLSFAESYAFAVVASTTWEYFGEIREPASINDLVVTPVSGVAIGEPLMQLAHFVQRSSGGLPAKALAFALAPMKTINEWTEGAQPSRDAPLPWHRFDLALGAGATVQERVSAGRTPAYFDQRLTADLRIASLPGYGAPGRQQQLFDDGNVSRVVVELALSRGELVDGLFATRLVPVGLWTRGVDGHGFLLGLRMGFEYGAHDYDRDRRRPVDVVGLASPLGIAFEHSFTRGPLQVRTGLDMSGAMSAVRSYGLARYAAERSLDDALTPIRNHGYYHAIAISTEPFVDVSHGALRVAASFRYDAFQSIRGLDEVESVVANGPRFGDRRTRLATSVAVVPPGTSWRLGLDLRRSSRAGRAGGYDDGRSELSAWASVGASF